jgi:hypothetical protein
MEEQQEQNQERQPEVVIEQPKKKTIPTCLGSLIILLTATIAGVGVWWYAGSYTPPEVIDVSGIVEQIKERREVKNELPEEYEIKAGGVYYERKLIEGADPETFEHLGGYHSKDKNNAYIWHDLIKEADPETFEHVEGYYSKDSSHVYCRSGLFKEADAETFEYSGSWHVWSYFKDKNHVYRGESIVDEIDDPATFQFLQNKIYAKDKNNVYYMVGGCAKIIKEADSETFEILGCYAKDKNYIYYNDKSRKEVDYLTAEYLGGQYLKDKNHVYYPAGAFDPEFVIVNSADPETFDYLDFFYAKDKNHVYIFGSASEKKDSATFEILNANVTKDKNHVYYIFPTAGSGIVKDVDTTTFETLDADNYCYKDKDSVYLLFPLSQYKTIEYEHSVPVDCTKENPYCCDDYNDPACLALGTKILMVDGNYKNIENIQVEDLVTSFNIETKEYTISKVDKVIKRKDPLVIINNTLRAAPDEPIYLADGSIKEAVDIEIGDYLINEKGGSIEVIETRYNAGMVDTYDFTLENAHNFFADGYLVGTPDF